MSDTPLTDAITNQHDQSSDAYEDYNELLNHAETLERQLSDCQRQLAEPKKLVYGCTLSNRQLAERLQELSSLVTQGRKGMESAEWHMRRPAEPNHDADLILSEAAMRLLHYTPQGKDNDG